MMQQTKEEKLQKLLHHSKRIEALGLFSIGLAHDLNNMITKNIGYADRILLYLEEDDPFYNDLSKIKKVSEQAANLIRQLFKYSRQQLLYMKVVSVNQIASDFSTMLYRLIGEDIELEMILEPSLGNIKADKGQIQQLLTNLAVNARDAMPRGGKLTIETANAFLDRDFTKDQTSAPLGPCVIISIRDNGNGIDNKTKKRIFEPFFTTKEDRKATGLGLSIVYGIVKQHGSIIQVYSRPGQGTTFKIFMPRTIEMIKN